MSSRLESSGKDSSSNSFQEQQVQCYFVDELGTEMVDLYVGAERRVFRVHKNLLCKRVPHFEKMFNFGLEETSTQIAKFPEDGVEAFDSFLQWVYTRDWSTNKVVGKAMSTKSTRPLVKVYILAQKFCQHHLMDLVMDQIAEHQRHWGQNYGLIKAVLYYSGTQSNCSLRQYLAHAVVCTLMNIKSRPKDIELAADFGRAFAECEDLAVDVMQCLRSQADTRPFIDPRYAPPCKFHSHGSDEECKVSNDKKMKRAN